MVTGRFLPTTIPRIRSRPVRRIVIRDDDGDIEHVPIGSLPHDRLVELLRALPILWMKIPERRMTQEMWNIVWEYDPSNWKIIPVHFMTSEMWVKAIEADEMAFYDVPDEALTIAILNAFRKRADSEPIVLS